MTWLKTLFLILCFAPAVFAQSDEKAVLAVVQRLFDAMAAHDADAAQAILIPEARVFSVREKGVASSTAQEFAARLRTGKEALLERMWNPKVLVHGLMAQVWAPYDFHRDRKFSHCGIDSFNLLKTPDGWKIAAVAYTVETTNCEPSPLGPPKD